MAVVCSALTGCLWQLRSAGIFCHTRAGEVKTNATRAPDDNGAYGARVQHSKEPLRDGGSAGPARADPADGRGRGPAGKGKLPAVWGRAAAGGAFEPADLAGGADRSRAAGGRHAGAAGLAAGSADPVSRTRRGEIRRRAGPQGLPAQGTLELPYICSTYKYSTYGTSCPAQTGRSSHCADHKLISPHS